MLFRSPTLWPAAWAQLGRADRDAFIDWWVQTHKGKEPEACLSWVLEDGLSRTRGKRKYTAVARSNQRLLTYQAEWGVVTLTSQPVPKDLDELLDARRQEKSVLHLWGRLQFEASQNAKTVGSQELALSLELGRETWQEAGKLRVHLHACLRAS